MNEEKLITSRQVTDNLIRAAEKELIALLDREKLINLALKYFGVYKDNELVGYRCPYSGKVYTNYKDIVLEHIIPIASNGGTVLFNCIPSSSEVNGADQKGARHLIEWWTNSKYWDKDAPKRLESIVNYIIEGYNHVFDEYTIEELETSYIDVLNNLKNKEVESNNQDNLSNSKRKEKEILEEQAKSNKIYSYLSFLNDCINELDKRNIDTTTIKDNLKELEKQEIFEEIDKYTLYQNTLKKVIANILGDDNKTYLTYSLNINIKKVIDIINETEGEKIYQSLLNRFNNIRNILSQNNLSIIDYFKNLGDIEEINLLYKNKVSHQEITEFIESIKLGHDSKINIFIDMLNHGEIDIFSKSTQKKFTTYKKDENGNDIVNKVYNKIGYFWSDNKEQIINKLFEGELKNNSKYDVARNTIDTYLIQNKNTSSEANQRRIEIFIEMLNHGEIDILSSLTTKRFTTYKKDENGVDIVNKVYDNIGSFWSNNKEQIMNKLFKGELKNNPKYNVARDTIDAYLMKKNNSSLEAYQRRIEVFIDMLNHGEIDILSITNNKEFTTYKKDENGVDIVNKTYDKIGGFWHYGNNKNIIMNKLFEEELMNNPEYDVARNTINTYLMQNKNKSPEANQRRIEVFIEMLNHGEIGILSKRNSIKFTTYKKDKNGDDIVNKVYDNIGDFWGNNKEQIMSKLFKGELKDNPEYDVARDTIDKYLMRNKNNSSEANQRRIEVFIEMLNHGEVEILSNNNQKKFTTYKKDENGVDIVNKKYDNIGAFWSSSNKVQIMNQLFKGELKDNPEYDVARDTIDTYLMRNKNNSPEAKQRRIEVFIEMLNHGEIEILSNSNQKKFTTYKKDENGNEVARKEYDKIGNFWQNNKDIINKILFEGVLKDNHEYDSARSAIKEDNFQNNLDKRIRVFIDMLNDNKTMTKDIKGNDVLRCFQILNKRNSEIFEGFPHTPINDFYRSTNKQRIIKILFEEELKDNPNYNVARSTILMYHKVSSIEEYYAKEKRKNEEQDKLSPEEIEFQNNPQKKINVFIEMLNEANVKILNAGNKETFKGYSHTNVRTFWHYGNNRDIIIQKLFEGDLKDNPKYDVARNTILKYHKVSSIEEYYEKEKAKENYKANLSQEELEFQNNLDARIRVFIEMLNDNKTMTKDNKGNDVLRCIQILNKRNNEIFEGFPNTLVREFYRSNDNKNLIIHKLFEKELKDNPKYDVARSTILKYHKVSSIEEYYEKEKKKKEVIELKKLEKQALDIEESIDKEDISNRRRA